MKAKYSDNWRQVQPTITRKIRFAKKRIPVIFVNNARYAAFLHRKAGYSVFTPSVLAKKLYHRLKRAGDLTEPRVINDAVEAGAIEGINAHRVSSFAYGSRPPVRAGEGLRAAHIGLWADITGVLKNSYFFIWRNKKIVQPEWRAQRARAARRRRRR